MEILENVDVSHEQAALIARALFSLSRVDGHEEREGMLIKSFWMEAVGQGSVLDLNAFQHLPDITGAEIARGLPTTELRRMFLKTAVLMTYADGTVSDKEREWLQSVSKDLGIEAELARTDELVRNLLLSQLSHIENVDALREVTKKLGLN
jgi:hypothetical protein